MHFKAQTVKLAQVISDCLVVGVYESAKLTDSAQTLDDQSGKQLSTIIKQGDITGKIGQTLLIHQLPGNQAKRVLLVGCGKKPELGERQYREILGHAAKALLGTGARTAVNCLMELPIKGQDPHWKARQVVEISHASRYRFEQLKSQKTNDESPLEEITLPVQGRREATMVERAIQEATAIAAAVTLAKNLGNLPGNICTPTYLAKQARELQKKPRIKVEVLEEAQMKQLGMGSLLSVSRGSRQPPKLIVVKYSGAAAKTRPVVLVGKGLTFDAGGISLKPSANMDEMKYDMSGAASVLGAISAAADLKLPINIVGIIPSSENLPDGNANKPGDIVTSLSGQTIEILNTDAEGRLILCDALTYAARFTPAVVIDVATLTGACVIALGGHASGLLSNHSPLARDLLRAGEETGDRAWELPLWEEYQEQLKSPFADMANVGGREAGTITGACFLARYTKDYHWAHLDIAGTAWKSGAQKGSTGRPVPLLTQYLLNYSKKAKA
ncbi:MAG: leucyl aminopeptidase [Gammaproteobacteria bacterium RBG_16_57_12]|nr:MAG: leucyl aminopeptidase [Gammaproteobacteria bacterium RBG_16_57_12]